jgi:hypothetical protein
MATIIATLRSASIAILGLRRAYFTAIGGVAICIFITLLAVR